MRSAGIMGWQNNSGQARKWHPGSVNPADNDQFIFDQELNFPTRRRLVLLNSLKPVNIRKQ